MAWPRGRKRSSRVSARRSISKRPSSQIPKLTIEPSIQSEIELASSPPDEIQVEAMNTDDQDEDEAGEEEVSEEEEEEEEEVEVEEETPKRRGRGRQPTRGRGRGRPRGRPRRNVNTNLSRENSQPAVASPEEGEDEEDEEVEDEEEVIISCFHFRDADCRTLSSNPRVVEEAMCATVPKGNLYLQLILTTVPSEQ